MKSIFKESNFEKYYKDLIPYFKKEKNQNYLMITLTICTSIFFFLFAINPTLSTIAKLKKQISDAQVVEKKLSEKINNLSSLSQAYEDIKPDLPLVMDAIPDSAMAPSLVGQIQALAKNSSITITDVNISSVNLNSRNSNVSSPVGFSATGVGSYENIQKFLSDLTNMQRVLSVNSIQMSKSIESGDIEIVIKGQGYFKKQ